MKDNERRLRRMQRRWDREAAAAQAKAGRPDANWVGQSHEKEDHEDRSGEDNEGDGGGKPSADEGKGEWMRESV